MICGILSASKAVISMGSPNGLSQWALQKSSPNELSKLRPGWSLLGIRWESDGSLLGVCWESAGSLQDVCWEYDFWNPRNTFSSYFNWLCKWALQKGSPNELSKLRPGWSLLGVFWESAWSPLGVYWESARSPCWESAGSPLGVHRESAGCVLGV